MAKAIFGHLGGPDPRLVDEVRRLRRRVVDLETEIGRLLAERELLSEVVLEHPMVTADSAGELAELDAMRTRAAALT